ncbi:MAG: hypothetical protein K9K82_14245 [Desulfobacteraceae bacterium]|nr:hypothetical protein [Desulfobacteraceae bacterium]
MTYRHHNITTGETMGHRWTMAASALLFFFSALFFSAGPTHGMEALSDAQMRNLTGQAGITLAAGDAVFEFWSDAMKFQDVNTLDMDGGTLSPDGYVKYDLHGIMVADDVLEFDAGVFYEEEPLEFNDDISGQDDVTRTFEHPLNNTAMVFLSHTANNPEFEYRASNISVYNHDTNIQGETVLGDLDVSGVNLYESKINIYPPAEDGTSGIRAVAGARAEIGSVVYKNPEQFENIFISGVMAGSGFSGDPADPGAWAFEDGMFELGIPYYYHDDPDQQDTELDSHPFTLDFATDAGRPGDFDSYMAINAPMRGSIRVKNISSNDFDMGPVAIDGIRLYKNYIEFPGRGIGN